MFYVLRRDETYPAVWYSQDVGFEPLISIKCPIDPGHQRGERDENVNLWIDIKKPKIGDFISTVFDWLISDHVAELLRAHNLTGYSLRPVKVCNRELSYNVWELSVTGSAGRAHDDSGIKMKCHCEACGMTRFTLPQKGVGIVVNEKTWDGSDIFTIVEFRQFVLVTEKVAKIIKDNMLRGIRLVPALEFGFEE